jgi:transcriptional regulator with XRE-family HTH domain
MNKNQFKDEFISDKAVLLKKMRLLRKLTRQQAALLFDFTFKTIEKLENGRGNITDERFRDFQAKYGFSDNEIEQLKSGKLKASTDPHSIRKRICDTKRKDRRFCHKKITKECKVLKELRMRKGISQYKASEICGFDKRSIGFIETGRVTLNEKKIHHIVSSYGFNIELFNQLTREPILKHEYIEQCTAIIESLDENNLRTIHPLLINLGGNRT